MLILRMKGKSYSTNFFKLIIIVVSLMVAVLAIFVTFNEESQVEDVSVWKKYNDSLFAINMERASKHPLGFNDTIYEEHKDSGVFRIAILGDSFVWGDGLPPDSSWSHQLELLLRKRGSFEVLHWGKNGWNTKDQIEFYLSAGREYRPDLLILGYVDNDPDMGRFTHMDPNFRSNYRFLYKIWPAGADKLLVSMYSSSYNRWLKRLHSEENIGIYKEMLSSFKDSLLVDSIDWFIVQTPACLGSNCEKYYKSVQPLYEELEIDYLDLYPACNKELDTFSRVELMANPVNFHPGTIMTRLFARETLNYMDSTARIPSSYPPETVVPE